MFQLLPIWGKTALYFVIAAREARFDKLQTRKEFPPIIRTFSFNFSMFKTN